MKVSISPSKLEQFHLHVTEAYHGTITREKVIESIKGLTPWTKLMEFGGAFHSVLENGSRKFYNPETGLYEVPMETFKEPFVLRPEEVAVADKYRARYPSMIHEIKTKLQYSLNGYDIVMNMRIDSMNGLDVHEKKTTDKPASRDKYESSLQWKCYVVASGARRAIYDVFQYSGKEPREIKPVEFVYESYPGVRSELEGWLKHFILFCENENLVEYIKPKY